MREFSLPIRVYIEDTDAGGIVYYVNYLKFFERARTELVRSLGHGKRAVMDDGTQFVVSKAEIHYREPARLDDDLVAVASCSEVSGATIDFDQKVLRDETVLVEGSVPIALIDSVTGRPKRLTADLRAALMNDGD
tara:strand:+ start:8360 stop:8764 length:405 start_codon:yes stop_codon:yes gene_type:complete